ncbi:tRNA 2-selenouridine(34) synthase MnmH [Massilia endophytica]|uniref:tRNA 2-selenouridine(34) synthase MnmH n=1 Tax=Massilia endophytica TaxID=2899220 RepID=UPI001E5D1AE8|nr:tRNA 2-selenouridine(34) synthase MnmH [Massilia endophytica]UGQ48519.1 tRNA 2-selenouridine(34) synthase MnmH [Massilia endophytica]
MKYPQLLGIDAVIAQLDEFDTIIDVRSPSEYALDHLPNAINCPVLDDEQRARVGTLYKQTGSFEAKKIGAALVVRNIGDHIEALWLDKPRDWKPLVYCWRGGNRSGTMAYLMAKIGWPVVQLDGGYKAFRNRVNADLLQTPELDFRVVCGTTGSGKTRLLQTLESIGAQVLDLEQLAAHRGSVLGYIPSQPQPSQKAFETSIWDRLRRFDPTMPVFVESESKKVGALRVPAALMDRVRASPCIAIELPRSERVNLLLEDYRHFVTDAPALNAQLEHLTPLHGRAKISQWQELALEGRMRELFEQLLVDHYDPAYLRSLDRNFPLLKQAQTIDLQDISPASYLAAARKLHNAG